MKKLLAISVALGCSFSFALSEPVHAFDYRQLFQSYLDGQIKGGNETQNATKLNINQRQAQLEQEIEAGVKTGQITSAEETELRNELVQIAHHEAEFLKDGTLQDPEVVKLLEEMNLLSSKINSFMTNSSTTGTGNLSHDEWFRKYGSKPNSKGYLPNAPLRQAHIDSMQAELDGNIQDALSAGYISWNESRDFQNRLNQIKNDEIIYLKDGRVDYSEEQKLLSSLRNLRHDFNEKTGYRYGYRDGRSSSHRGYRDHRNRRRRIAQKPLLHQRIAAGISQGKISRSEARELYSLENKIHNLESQLRGNHNYSFEQQKNMFKELEQLTETIDKKLLGI